MTTPYHGTPGRCDRAAKALLVMLVIAIGFAAPNALAQGTDRDAMMAVITDQMTAFKQNDAEAAFAFASPQIQSLFGTPERFMTMVRTGYPQIYRPRAAEVRDLTSFRGQPALVVDIIGQDDRSVVALYVMLQLADGAWRINGCYLLSKPDIGA